MNCSILNDLQAENLLRESHILTQVKTLRDGLRYKTDHTEVSYDDFFEQQAKDIAGLPRIELDATIAPGTEDAYLIKLSSALEQVIDNTDRVLSRAMFFQGKLRTALHQANSLGVAFSAWYQIAAGETLKTTGLKLPAASVKALGEAEFSRLMGGLDVDVEGMLEAVKVQVEQLKMHKKVALEKFNLGKQQAQAAWGGNLPGVNGYRPDDGSPLLKTAPIEEEEPDDEVPAFVSKKPQIATAVEDEIEEMLCDDCGKSVEGCTCEQQAPPPVPITTAKGPDGPAGLNDIKGTFKKQGSPAPAIPVVEDYTAEALDVLKNMPPRRTLTFDDETVGIGEVSDAAEVSPDMAEQILNNAQPSRDEQIEALKNLPDDTIDTSDIPELTPEQLKSMRRRKTAPAPDPAQEVKVEATPPPQPAPTPRRKLSFVDEDEEVL